MRGVDVHLQVGRIPALGRDRDGLTIPTPTSRNRSRGARSFRIHSGDRLRAEGFACGICLGRRLEVAIDDITGATRTDYRAVGTDSHPHASWHLPRHFLIGFENVRCASYWIADFD